MTDACQGKPSTAAEVDSVSTADGGVTGVRTAAMERMRRDVVSDLHATLSD
jgi:hypothetical protein